MNYENARIRTRSWYLKITAMAGFEPGGWYLKVKKLQTAPNISAMHRETLNKKSLKPILEDQ